MHDLLDALRTGRHPNADIKKSHWSGSLSHLANIVARLGRQVRFDPKTTQIVGDDEANQFVRRRYREGHWAVPKGV